MVEGYTDVIAMHLAGMPIAVATCGTALGEDHLDLLRRFSERVVFAFDADEAGVGAALRGFDRSVPGDLDLRVAALPDGKDPADVVADGDIDRLRKAVDESEPLLKVRIQSELDRYDLSEPEARAKAVRSAAAVIALHPDPVTRHEYAVMVSRDTGVDLRMVESAMRPSAGRSTQEPPPDLYDADAPSAPTQAKRSPTHRTESELLRVMLANDARLDQVDVRADLFGGNETREAYDMVAGLLEGLSPGATPDLGATIANDERPAAMLLTELALDPKPLADPEDLVRTLDIASVDRDIAAIRKQLNTTDQEADAQGYSELLQELIALEQRKRDLRSERD